MDYDLREDVDVKDRERALSMKYYSDLDPAPWEEKLSCLPTKAVGKLQETLQRVVNEGSGTLICIIL